MITIFKQFKDKIKNVSRYIKTNWKLLKWKITVTGIKTSRYKLKSKLFSARDKTDEEEYSRNKKIQNEIEKHKSMDKSEHSINDKQDMVQNSNVCIWSPKGRGEIL